MARKFLEKKRGTGKKATKPLIILITEGQNETEKNYFGQFRKQDSLFNIKILRSGWATDPKHMLKNLESYWKEYELSEERGDQGYVVLDLDCDEKKAKLVEKLQKRSENNIRFIVSNPCFEVWFLLHYQCSTHIYADGNEVIRELKKHIPNYQKNMDVFPILSGNLDRALKNADKLEAHFNKMGSPWPSDKCNPRTDAPEVVKKLI